MDLATLKPPATVCGRFPWILLWDCNAKNFLHFEGVNCWMMATFVETYGQEEGGDALRLFLTEHSDELDLTNGTIERCI